MNPSALTSAAQIAARGLSGLSGAQSSSSGSSWNQGASHGQNSSYGQTYGNAATQASINAAAVANEAQMQAWREAAEFNAREAKKARDWQEKMSNSVYQRTVKDMIAAGINPVLAAGAGLGTASVGGGTSASVGVPSMSMANAYPEQVNSSYGVNDSYEKGGSQSQSYYEAGLATALKQLGDMVGSWVNTKTAAQDINLNIDGLKGWFGDKTQDIKDIVREYLGEDVSQKLGLENTSHGSSGGGRSFENNPVDVKGSGKTITGNAKRKYLPFSVEKNKNYKGYTGYKK